MWVNKDQSHTGLSYNVVPTCNWMLNLVRSLGLLAYDCGITGTSDTEAMCTLTDCYFGPYLH